MYIAKLFSTALAPVCIISINVKSVSEAKRYAISVASGYDAIRTIEIYANDTKIDSIDL